MLYLFFFEADKSAFISRCAPGYYGNPTTSGGSCRRCSCGSNIDVTRPGVCNNITGACTVCGSNTEGIYCEKCRSGYYGSAVNGDCRRK